MDNLIWSAVKQLLLIGVCSMGLTTVEATTSLVNIEVCYNDNATLSEKVEADIKDRLNNMNGLVDMKVTPEVMSYIKSYLRYEEGTSAILGRQATFFPLFEDVLIRNNLPTDLKYLSIVESSLNPNAFSRVGAAGLWQFMRGTGRMMGLTINRTIDERRNPYKSTEAAASYLQLLYSEFNDWTLALAAYNSGPGRVKRAMKKANSRDFWTLRKYLPKETRNYVPAFIAVNYLANYYYLHNIQPTLEHPDLMAVTNVTLYQHMTFKEIEDITGASPEIIQKLNPCYLKKFVPGNITGSYVLLPNYAASLLLHHLYRPDQPQEAAYDIDIDNTMLSMAELKLLRMPVSIPEFLPSALTTKIDNDKDLSDFDLDVYGRNEEDPIWYSLKKRESLRQIAQDNKIPLRRLLELNDALEEDLVPGTRIRLR